MSNSVYITSTASFLPNAPVSNDRMEQVLGQIGAKPSRARRTILRSNGIQTRHYAIDPETRETTHTNAQLTAAAIRNLGDAAFAIEQLDCLVCGTSIPDQLMPNHAVMVQGELGLPAVEAVATSGVCLSGLSALKYAYLSVAAGSHQRAVASGSEASSSMLCARNYSGEHIAEIETDAELEQLAKRPELAFDKDFLRWMLSDGAGAFLLQPAPRAGGLSLRIDWIDIFSYAGEMPACMYAGALKNADATLTGWAQLDSTERARHSVLAVKQDVKLLNENIIRYTIEKPLAAILEKRRLHPADIDYFVPHYSSEYFRHRVYAGLQNVDFSIPMERWFTNLTTKGNTGAASMYIMIDELFHSGRLQAGDRLLCWVPESGRFSSGFMHFTAVAGAQ